MAFENFFIQPNIMNWDYSFPQIEFVSIELPSVNNIWNNYFSPETNKASGSESNTGNVYYMDIPVFNITPPAFFNFSPIPQFTLPSFDLGTSIQTFNYQPFSYQPIFTQPTPVENKKKEDAQQTTKPTDEEVSETKPAQKSKSSKFKPKSKKVKLGNKVKVKSEEIKPGYYICKQDGVDIQNLKPCMKDALIEMNEKAKELGYDLVLSSGYRSHESQKRLKKEKPKYAASPYKSAHEYGVAIDMCLYKNGEKVSVDKVPEFAHYAESLGLIWGGRWKNQYEPWHFNMNDWKDLAEVRDEYRRLNSLA